MVLDFLSAPGITSIFLQSSAWYRTPFFDDKIATQILSDSESMKRGKKGKGKARQDAGSDHDQDDVKDSR
ncbi:hypothetical protein BDR05DRAFT_1060521 [Suillus weaverae]|nr:hypothetical protein BDR05DRAFT_1060521 [Suillus weaverae]